jgi:hypothetical protein
VIFHLSVGVMWGVFKLFIPSALEDMGMGWMLLALYDLGLVCFVLYDIALTRLITFYLFRLRKYFRIK